MSRSNADALSFHRSHIKWILYIYSALHLLIAGVAVYAFFVFKEFFLDPNLDYTPIVYSFAIIEVVLAAECFVIRPFLKRFYKSGLSLFFLYLVMRLIVNLAAAIYLVIAFPHMFHDFFSFITNFNLEGAAGGYITLTFAAPLFLLCLANFFLCTTSFIYYIRKRANFK